MRKPRAFPFQAYSERQLLEACQQIQELLAERPVSERGQEIIASHLAPRVLRACDLSPTMPHGRRAKVEAALELLNYEAIIAGHLSLGAKLAMATLNDVIGRP